MARRGRWKEEEVAASEEHSFQGGIHCGGHHCRSVLFPLSLSLLLLLAGQVGGGDETSSSAEEVDGGLAVGDHEALETKASKELGLHLGSGLGDGLDGPAANGLHQRLELVGLNRGQLACLVQLQVVQRLLVGDLSLL